MKTTISHTNSHSTNQSTAQENNTYRMSESSSQGSVVHAQGQPLWIPHSLGHQKYFYLSRQDKGPADNEVAAAEKSNASLRRVSGSNF